MKRSLFAQLVMHGPKRFSRRQKKDTKRTYLRIIAAVAARNYENETGREWPAWHAWRHVQRLRVEVSFSPLTATEAGNGGAR